MIPEKLATMLANDRFANLSGIRLISAGEGKAVAELEIADQHLNGVNIIQGGAIFTLADFTFAAASNSRGRIAVATNATISFLKGISGGKLKAVASEIRAGKTIGNYVVEVFDEHENLVAHFTGTAFIKGTY